MIKKSRQINFLATRSDLESLSDCVGVRCSISSRVVGREHLFYRSISEGIDDTRVLVLRRKSDTLGTGVEFTASKIDNYSISPGRFYLNYQLVEKVDWGEVEDLYNFLARCVRINCTNRLSFYWSSDECKRLISEGYTITL